MKKPYRFVQEYTTVLTLKQSKRFNYSKRFFIDFWIALFLSLSTILLIGQLFHFLENFNYVAFSINAAIFGSFLFSLYEREQTIQAELRSTYTTLLGFLFELISILAIQLTVTSFVFFFCFDALVNTATLIMIFILSSIIFFLQFWLAVYSDGVLIEEEDGKTAYHHQKQVALSIVFIVLIHQYYMIVLYIHLFDSIVFTTLFWTGVLLIVFTIRYQLRTIYINVLSNMYVRIALYFLTLVLFASQIPRLTYDMDLRDEFYVSKEPQYETIGEIVPMMVQDYSHEDILLYDGHVLISRYESISGEEELIENPYLTAETQMYRTDYNYYFESIVEQSDGYHHVILRYSDVELLEETYHTITNVEPDFLKSEYLYTDYGPAIISRTIYLNETYYCQTNIGIMVFDQNFQFIRLIDRNTEVPMPIQNEFDAMNKSGEIYTYKEYTLKQDNDTFELEIVYNGETIPLENPYPHLTVDEPQEWSVELRVTEDYYIVHIYMYVITYTKSGEYVDSIKFASMNGLSNTIIDENGMIQTIHISYYDSMRYTHDGYRVFQLDPAQLGNYEMRDEFRSWLNCELPYGCTEYNPMFESNYILIQMGASLTVLIIPFHKKEDVVISQPNKGEGE